MTCSPSQSLPSLTTNHDAAASFCRPAAAAGTNAPAAGRAARPGQMPEARSPVARRGHPCQPTARLTENHSPMTHPTASSHPVPARRPDPAEKTRAARRGAPARPFPPAPRARTQPIPALASALRCLAAGWLAAAPPPPRSRGPCRERPSLPFRPQPDAKRRKRTHASAPRTTPSRCSRSPPTPTPTPTPSQARSLPVQKKTPPLFPFLSPPFSNLNPP